MLLEHPNNLKLFKKAERQLMNEWIRTINNTIELSDLQHDTCIEQLSWDLDKLLMNAWPSYVA